MQQSINFTLHLKENALRLFDRLSATLDREGWVQCYKTGNFRETNDRQVFAFDLMLSNCLKKGNYEVSFSNFRKTEPYTIIATIWHYREPVERTEQTTWGTRKRTYRPCAILHQTDIKTDEELDRLIARVVQL